MEEQAKIDEIMNRCADLIPLLKTVGVPRVYTLRRAQLLLDWINAGNENERKVRGIEVGGKYFNETLELEEQARLIATKKDG